MGCEKSYQDVAYDFTNINKTRSQVLGNHQVFGKTENIIDFVPLSPWFLNIPKSCDISTHPMKGESLAMSHLSNMR